MTVLWQLVAEHLRDYLFDREVDSIPGCRWGRCDSCPIVCAPSASVRSCRRSASPERRWDCAVECTIVYLPRAPIVVFRSRLKSCICVARVTFFDNIVDNIFENCNFFYIYFYTIIFSLTELLNKINIFLPQLSNLFVLNINRRIWSYYLIFRIYVVLSSSNIPRIPLTSPPSLQVLDPCPSCRVPATRHLKRRPPRTAFRPTRTTFPFQADLKNCDK